MGQKVHPEGLRVGYIHDWKSNWFNEKDFSDYLFEDIQIREHIIGRLSHAGLSDITIRKNANEVEVNIHTARPGIVIGKSGSEVDALRRDLHKITNKQVKVNILEIKRPELDATLVAQSIAEQLAEPRRLPPRDEARADERHALRREGRQGPGLRPPRRRRDGAHRGLLRRPRPAAHAARGHRLRLPRGAARRSAASASSAGSTRARSCPRATPAPTSRRWTSAAGARSRRRGERGDGRGGGRGGGPAAAVAAAAVAGGGGPGGRRAAGGRAVRRSRRRTGRSRGGRRSRGGPGGRPWWAGSRWRPAAPAAVAVRRPGSSGPRARGDSLMLSPKRVKYRKQHRGRRRGLSRGQAKRPVRRVRPQGDRRGLAHQPSDRGRSYRDDAQDQAWRQGLDQRLSRTSRTRRSRPRRAWAPARARPKGGSPSSSPAA